jgi:hypothetical protein
MKQSSVLESLRNILAAELTRVETACLPNTPMKCCRTQLLKS